MAPSRHVPLVFFNLEQLLCLSFTFMNLTSFLILGGFFIACPSVWVCLMEFHGYPGYVFWARHAETLFFPLQATKLHEMSIYPVKVMATFSFVANPYFMGGYFVSM